VHVCFSSFILLIALFYGGASHIGCALAMDGVVGEISQRWLQVSLDAEALLAVL